MDNQLSVSQAQAPMNTNPILFLRKRAMTLEKNKDQRMKQTECPAQDHISMKMLSLNMVLKWSQVTGLDQGLLIVRISKHFNNKVEYQDQEAMSQRKKFIPILVESLEKI